VHSYARGINDAGTIAGMSTGRGPSNTSIQRAVIWTGAGGGGAGGAGGGGAGGEIIDLGTLGGVFSEGFAINNAGQVVGWAWDPAWRQRGFVWSPQGGMVDVGDFGAPGSVVARAIADTGVAVGVAPGAGAAEGRDRAFRWESGVLTDLGVLPEAGLREGMFGPELVNTAAAGVNSAGQIVGNSYPGSDAPPLRPGPFIWENGVMTNLNDLVDPGWVILSVGGINESGQIVATARPAGTTTGSRAVILTPTGCYANCDASTTAPVLNVADFTCFLQRFAAGESYANCDASTTAPVLNVADFTCFLQRFAAGCS
jgi:probable HAF family extracellular repeat protein